MDDAERIAGLVEIAEAGECHFDVAHFAQRAAADDALVGKDFGRRRVRAQELRHRRGGGHGTGRDLR
jgi:hypothetical protein